MDGGMTDNLPLPPGGGRTICVSPFAGRQEICPGGPAGGRRGKGMYVKIHSQTFAVSRGNVVRGLHAFFPPPRPVLLGYFRHGQADAAAFLCAQGWWQQGDEGQHAHFLDTLLPTHHHTHAHDKEVEVKGSSADCPEKKC
jgi:hypothetical protein